MKTFRQFVEQKGPQNHDELLAQYNDPESQMLIGKGIHPGTLEPIPVHLRPSYGFAKQDAPTPAAPSGSPMAGPAYKLMQNKPDAGQKDKFGRTIYNTDQHPHYLQSQDDIRQKMSRGKFHKSKPGHNPEDTHDRFGRRQGYDLA